MKILIKTKLKYLFIGLGMVCLIAACSKKENSGTPGDSGNNSNNDNDPNPKIELSVLKKHALATGGTVKVIVKANGYAWGYDLGSASSWISEVEKVEDTLKLKIEKNSNESPRKGEIAFQLTKETSFSKNMEVVQLGQPGLLQVAFVKGRGGMDGSPMRMDVQTKNYSYPLSLESSLVGVGSYSTFNPKENGWQPGENEGSYFRIDYENNTSFKEKLADGHSFECMVKFDQDYSTPQNYETKFFSTHQAGGTGFLITESGQGNEITFLPNVSKDEGGGSHWRWAKSGIIPEKDTWYHLVGVWDKDQGKAYIYVNGEKKGEADAEGYYRPSSAGNHWVALGGDPDGDKIQNTFKGSLLMPSIYDKPLTEEDVALLWDYWKEKIK